MGRKWTPEEKQALREKMLARRSGTVADVASISGTSPDDVKKLLEEVSDLKRKLAVAEAGRSEAEKKALEAAEASGAFQIGGATEMPTGRTVKVQRLSHYKVVGHKEDGRDIIRPVFKEVEIPTYYYKVDMPPCGGTDFKINGVAFYHGTTYEFDIDTLRTVKEIVYRVWDHDRQIHGDRDENAYRKPIGATNTAQIAQATQMLSARLRG